MGDSNLDGEKKTIFLDDSCISYLLVRRRIRCPRIEASSDGIRVIIPKNLKNELPFINKHSNWVLKRWVEICKAKEIFESLKNQLLIFGEPFKFENGDFEFNFEEKTIKFDEKNEKHRKKFEKILKTELYALIKEFADEYTKRLNVSYKKIKIRRQRTKWASYSTNGNICFNINLAFIPKHLIRYIVFHELAHSKVINHNKQFWNIVDGEFNDRKEIKKALRDYWLLAGKMNERLQF